MTPGYSSPKSEVNLFEWSIVRLLWECSGEYLNKCDSCPVFDECLILYDSMPSLIKLDDYDHFLSKFAFLKEKRIILLKYSGKEVNNGCYQRLSQPPQ